MQSNTLCLFMIGLVLFVVTACNTTSSRYHHGRFAGGPEHDFGYYLAIGYEQLAAYEEYLDKDPEAAARFVAKSRDAARSPYPMPDMPAIGSYPEKERAGVKQAYEVMRDALTHFQGQQESGNDRYLAEAQVNFDCWIERLGDEAAAARDGSTATEKGGQYPHSEKLSESCRTMFYEAIGALQLSDDFRFSAFFDSGDALLNEQTMETVRQTAEAFIDDELWRVRLIGRADPSGNYEDNVVLSMRRAIAVRNALAQYGVDPDRIVIDAVGAADNSGLSSDPAKARRVDLTIAPVYIGYDRNGPDIHEILPHYFSESGD